MLYKNYRLKFKIFLNNDTAFYWYGNSRDEALQQFLESHPYVGRTAAEDKEVYITSVRLVELFQTEEFPDDAAIIELGKMLGRDVSNVFWEKETEPFVHYCDVIGDAADHSQPAADFVFYEFVVRDNFVYKYSIKMCKLCQKIFYLKEETGMEIRKMDEKKKIIIYKICGVYETECDGNPAEIIASYRQKVREVPFSKTHKYLYFVHTSRGEKVEDGK